ncbi:hypothetical protein N7495_006897 [Penicillium taxi]|uniref:uncharacterized protein n=1 Tax=Penicillium taxi TaxID=168475 RepID=UPI0025455C3B|nr:uncharacterized protein N7495_006897 [Penicillium taxi]KAJ5895206.1 hypothetical protein N7495_006897 [Penicillium taxi]
MSQRLGLPSAQYSMSPIDEQHQDAPPRLSSPFDRSDGDSSRRTGAKIIDGRVSMELEGSTFAKGSRDGERAASGHSRAQSSSRFLLDSLPRSKSSRISSSHRPQLLEPPTEKRTAPEADIVVPKKKSRFHWARHKKSASELISEEPTSSQLSPQQAPTPPPDVQPSRTISANEIPKTSDPFQSTTEGLDKDSIQIVNLALNLNESRKRNASGLQHLGPGGRRQLSVSQTLAAPKDIHASSASRGNATQPDFSYHTYPFSDNVARTAQSDTHPPVTNFLPAAMVNDNRDYEFSASTIARAEKARRHLELFHEYLRLLPLLPPLRNANRNTSVENDIHSHHDPPSAPTSREYNPLQVIRNRRLRYREKCPIDAEAQGWHDVDKVHEWVNVIEAKYKDKGYENAHCIKLPSLQQANRLASIDSTDMVPDSSPLRRVSHTNSMKSSRPRLDWKISPAELLADAAWLEDPVNKAKIVDKDGNKLYPDLMELVLMETNPDGQRKAFSLELDRPVEEGFSSRHTSMSSAHPALAQEFKSVARGRHKHRFQSHSQGLRGRSRSSSKKPSRWDKVRIRTGSVSSDSSEERISEPRTKSSTAAAVTKRNKTHISAKVSISSVGSTDDRYNSRPSLDAVDSTAPNSPVQAPAGYFPSIAVNFSPPSSRSPSPAKKGLRQKIVSRHERSKSKHGQEIEDETPIVEPLPPPATSTPKHSERASKLEPSPLPDIVSYADDHGTSESNRSEPVRGQKGPNRSESKLREILKGPGRIAEMVGYEVSKVGEMIMKKDTAPDSRRSSSTSSIDSVNSDSDEEKRPDKRSGARGLLRRLPTFTEEPSRIVRRETDRGTPSRSFIPSLSSFTPLKNDEKGNSTDVLDFDGPSSAASRRHDEHNIPKPNLPRARTLDFNTTLNTGRNRTHQRRIKDPIVPFGLTRLPVTGLAQARASPDCSLDKGRRLSAASRSWSISGRSLSTNKDSGVPGKSEVERTHTLLFSSGIKGREITRRAHSVRNPPPPWLQVSVGAITSFPRVTRINEFDLAAQKLLQRFETTQYSFQKSVHLFATATSSPLRSQLKDLEILINQSLTPRVRATADTAENLCVQLNTTSTLAVKSLSDALDKGVRKRRRRLRWVRRTGFVLLEWALVGMLWWVWLIVMVFKVFRGIVRGVFSGARWILWL